MYKKYLKRFFDFLISFTALLFIWPLLLLVTILLAIFNRGAGAFFFQERPGVNGKIFKIIKFKTMTDERDAAGKLLPDVKRITRIGRFVRSTSLDELPQLINVLKGDMSLIGPRPLTSDYLSVYTREQARRHEVRPGISGWAQVHGRNLCKLSKKFEYDVWYVDHCTFLTDLKIVFLTIWNVINRKDIGIGAGNMQEIDDLGISEKLRIINKNKQR